MRRYVSLRSYPLPPFPTFAIWLMERFGLDWLMMGLVQTLLYMLLQRAGTGTIPPTGFNPPVWSSLVESWKQIPQPKTATVTLGPASITLGHDDDEEEDESTDVQGHQFGWDNEHPKREIQVRKFKIEWRPITNGEFYEFFFPAANRGRRGDVQFPASWVEIDGDILVSRRFNSHGKKVAQIKSIINHTRFCAYVL